jgi:predicted ATPase
LLHIRGTTSLISTGSVGLQTQTAALDALECLLARIRKASLRLHHSSHAADGDVPVEPSLSLQPGSSPDSAETSSKKDVTTVYVQNTAAAENSRKSAERYLHGEDPEMYGDVSAGNVQKTAMRDPIGGDPGICGVYLWGPVGSGKTMLMDLLASATSGSSVQSGESSKEWKAPRMLRVHFHEFMLTVHSSMHELQQALPRRVSGSRDGLPVYR